MSAVQKLAETEFFHDLRWSAEFGAPTRAVVADGVPYYVNAFWTAGQRRAHPLHEISYRACFKPQLPAFFIDRLTQPGDVVCDPFMGRGTTVLQAALHGTAAIGSDANPLSLLLTRPRLRLLRSCEIEARLAAAPWGRGEIERDDLLAFYHSETLRQICALRRYLLIARRMMAPRRRRRLDSNGGAQSTDRPFARVLFRLYDAAEPGRVGQGAIEDQCASKANAAAARHRRADYEEIARASR